jgi:hypothetical protein
MGPGVGAARASVCPVRGRLYPFRSQPQGRRTSEGKRNSLPRREAQTDGEPAEERRGAAMGAEVCELQFYLASATAAADCAAGVSPIQGTSPGTDGPDPRVEHRTHGRGVIPLSAGLAGLLRAVSSAIGVARSRGVDQAPASVCALEAVAPEPGPVWRTSPAGCGARACRANDGQFPWPLANPALALALSNAFFNSLGIPSSTGGQSFIPPNRRMRTRMSGGVGGEEL